MSVSPHNTGELPSPCPCFECIVPRSSFHCVFPRWSTQYRPCDPKCAKTNSPSVTGDADARLAVTCPASIGIARCNERCHRTLPVSLSIAIKLNSCLLSTAALSCSPGRPLIFGVNFSPMGVAVVTKIAFPQTTGVLCPFPGIGVFHTTFSVGLQ